MARVVQIAGASSTATVRNPLAVVALAAQNRMLGSNNFNPILAFVLIFFPPLGLISLFLVQSNLNRVWERSAAIPFT